MEEDILLKLENVEICRAEHEDKKKEPSFDGSFFLPFA